MPQCEDFPCCGHEAGQCPTVRKNGTLVHRCCECGKALARNATSSICKSCIRAMQRRMYSNPDNPWGDPY